jgi:hypothetical protein
MGFLADERFRAGANPDASSVSGEIQIDLSWLAFLKGSNPSTVEMMFAGKAGLLIAVVSLRTLDDTCRDRQ